MTARKSTPKEAGSKRLIVKSVAQATDLVRGKQGQRLIEGITNSMCGSTKLAAGFVIMPAGRIANPHLHENCESIIFVLEGWAVTLAGPDLEVHVVGPGDFLFVPEKVIHAAVNLSDEHRVIALEIRSEKHFNEDVIILPELVEKVEAKAAELRAKFAAGELPLPEGWREQIGKPFNFVEDRIADQLYDHA